MPADTLHADTAAVRALGAAFAAHAADLNAAAATLRSAPSLAAVLGPVGERFANAFAHAVSTHSAAVAAMGAHTEAGAVRAADTAAGYDTAGERAAQLLPRV